MKDLLDREIKESYLAKKSLLNNSKIIQKAIEVIFKKISKGGKIFLCGNGGSAADAQHLAAEFLVRLRKNVNRPPIAAISLFTDPSTITACANDYDFKYIYSRNLEALGSNKDVLIVISTSGNSENIIEATKIAKKKKIFIVGFLGGNGGSLKSSSDLSIIVDSKKTNRIQEAHIFIGHFIFEQVENLYLRYIS
jgi:D-sedoheptulose 7-phosphate isomerase